LLRLVSFIYDESDLTRNSPFPRIFPLKDPSAADQSPAAGGPVIGGLD